MFKPEAIQKISAWDVEDALEAMGSLRPNKPSDETENQRQQAVAMVALIHTIGKVFPTMIDLDNGGFLELHAQEPFIHLFLKVDSDLIAHLELVVSESGKQINKPESIDFRPADYNSLVGWLSHIKGCLPDLPPIIKLPPYKQWPLADLE